MPPKRKTAAQRQHFNDPSSEDFAEELPNEPAARLSVDMSKSSKARAQDRRRKLGAKYIRKVAEREEANREFIEGLKNDDLQTRQTQLRLLTTLIKTRSEIETKILEKTQALDMAFTLMAKEMGTVIQSRCEDLKELGGLAEA